MSSQLITAIQRLVTFKGQLGDWHSEQFLPIVICNFQMCKIIKVNVEKITCLLLLF